MFKLLTGAAMEWLLNILSVLLEFAATSNRKTRKA